MQPMIYVTHIKFGRIIVGFPQPHSLESEMQTNARAPKQALMQDQRCDQSFIAGKNIKHNIKPEHDQHKQR